MKNKEPGDRMNGKRQSRKAKYISAIPFSIIRQRLKVNPAEHQRKCYRAPNQASPHDQPVSPAAKLVAPKDETIQSELAHYPLEPIRDVASQIRGSKEDLPASLPVKRRG